MNTSVINIKTEPEIKAKAKIVASELGFNLSSLVNAYLRQLIYTRTVNFTLPEVPSKYTTKALKESKMNIRKGKVKSFHKTTEVIKWLDDVIDGD